MLLYCTFPSRLNRLFNIFIIIIEKEMETKCNKPEVCDVKHCEAKENI